MPMMDLFSRPRFRQNQYYVTPIITVVRQQEVV